MKQNRILHIELGAEAADVIGWMRSLPSRTINQTVNEILSSESRGKIRKIPHEFSSAKEDEHLSCGLVIRDRAALNFVAKIPKGEIKSTLVKIIRKHIRKNKELPPAPIDIHGGILIDVLRNFVTKMETKEAEYAGVPNKYSKLCEANDKAYHALRDIKFCLLRDYSLVNHPEERKKGKWFSKAICYCNIGNDSFLSNDYVCCTYIQGRVFMKTRGEIERVY